DDAIGDIAEDAPQRMYLGGGAASARRGISLVRDKDHLRADLAARNAGALFGFRDQVFHHTADMLYVEARAVIRAVGGDGAEQLADGPDAALAGGIRALHDQARRAHPDNHAVTAPVEREGGLGDDLVRGGGAAGQERRPHPLEHMVGGDVVRRDNDHTAAASGTDPVVGQSDRLGGAGAGGVDLRVGTARADEFGELRVAHGQQAEDHP